MTHDEWWAAFDRACVALDVEPGFIELAEAGDVLTFDAKIGEASWSEDKDFGTFSRPTKARLVSLAGGTPLCGCGGRPSPYEDDNGLCRNCAYDLRSAEQAAKVAS